VWHRYFSSGGQRPYELTNRKYASLAEWWKRSVALILHVYV
jgi:hypothetical protein